MFSFTGPKEKDHQENAEKASNRDYTSYIITYSMFCVAATTKRRLPTEIIRVI